MKEAVIFDRNGKEVDWYDPIEVPVRETKKYWFIDNAYHIYKVYRRKGYTLVVRVKEEQ